MSRYIYRLTTVAALVASICCNSAVRAQNPPVPERIVAPVPPTIPDGPSIRTVQPRGPRPNDGPQSIGSFIDSLSANDARFDVLVGQGRLLTTKEDIARERGQALVAVGDPSVADFIVVGARQIRVLGLRFGATDLVVTTADGRNYSFEVQVVADLEYLRARLRETFPEASIRLAQFRKTIVVEGEVRTTLQSAQVVEAVNAYIESIQPRRASGGGGGNGGGGQGAGNGGSYPDGPFGAVSPDTAALAGATGFGAAPTVINLLRVPGVQQVLLKVRVAELNRTAMREIGADFLVVDPKRGTIIGTQIGGATVEAAGTATAGLVGEAVSAAGSSTTAFGIFPSADFEIMLRALRRNSLLKILAEPNLIAMNGHEANFLAGGEFPIPVPQFGSGGGATTVTVQFREFGVRLGFVPYILDRETIRLSVDPEVSSIDFALGTTLVEGGDPVPGLNTRKAHTTVELRQGQTLAIAGLLQLELSGETHRIPGLGDLPYIGPFFSNTTNKRVEKELVVLVTPYLVEPMNCDQVPPSPGEEVYEPNDLEFYLLNRIEGRTGRDFRSTVNSECCRCPDDRYRLEKKYVNGQNGYCE